MDDLQQLRKLAQRYRASKARADNDLAERNAFIYEVLSANRQSQAAVCRAVDLTREQVRRITEKLAEADPPAAPE